MNFVYIACSIDGFIAKEDGDVDWLHEVPNPSGSDYGYAEFMQNIDALVMGRHSFEKVLSFPSWPYEKPVFVLSSSMQDVPTTLAGKVEIIKGSAADVSNDLKSRGFHHLYIDGGKVIQSFLEADLIDELIVTRIPILLGRGIPLFAQLNHPKKLSHVNTQVYDNALVKSHYRRTR